MKSTPPFDTKIVHDEVVVVPSLGQLFLYKILMLYVKKTLHKRKRLFANGDIGRRGWLVSCFLGLFFGVSIVLGWSYDQADSIEPLANNVVLSIVVLLLLVAVLSLLFELIYRFVDKISCRENKKLDESAKLAKLNEPNEPDELNKSEESVKSDKSARSKNGTISRIARTLFEKGYSFPLVAFVLFFIWSFWLISFYPGMTDADTANQLLQGAGMISRSDHHPWFDSYIFWSFITAGEALGSKSYGLFAYACIQLFVCAFGFSLLFKKLLLWNCPQSVRIVLFCFVALMPIIPIMALYMMKDSLFAVVFLPWMILFVDAVITKGSSLKNKRTLFAFIVLAFLSCMTKKTGVYVVIICCVIAFFWISRRFKLRFAVIAVCSLVPFFIWTNIVLPAIGIPSGSSAEIMSIPSQQIARYAQSYELTSEEAAGVEAVYSCSADVLAEGYDPRRADYTKSFWAGGDVSQLMQFGQAYLSMFLKHPDSFIAATWNNVYDYFYPSKKIMLGTWPNFEDSYIDGLVRRSYEDVTEQDIRSYLNDLIVDMNELLENPPLARTIYVGLQEIPVINILFCEAIYCSWIPFLLVGLAIRRKSVCLFLCSVPCLVVLLTLIAGPISLARYMPASVYGAILLVGLLFSKYTPSTAHAENNPKLSLN